MGCTITEDMASCPALKYVGKNNYCFPTSCQQHDSEGKAH